MFDFISNRALRELNPRKSEKATAGTPVKTATRHLAVAQRPKIASNVLEVIGNTPMVKLNSVMEGCGAEVIVKLESSNPGGSVKDRIAMNMILEAEKRGEITPGKTVLVEATSGNTGIGLAMVAAARGYELILTMPETMSLERRVVLKAYGAKVVLTPAPAGVAGVIKKAEQIVASTENAVMLQQFSNPANPRIHYLTTGPEIWRDTDGNVDIFVSAVGTGGTLTGCGGYLKAQNPALTIAAVEPAESAVLSGGKPGPHKIQGIGAGFVPENCNTDLIDLVVPVFSDEAITMARRLAMEEGIFCGISAGAAVAAAVQLALRPENSGKRIVAIVPDYGERYLSTALFSELTEEAKNQATEAI